MNAQRHKIRRLIALVILAPVFWMICIFLVNSLTPSFNDSDFIFSRPEIPQKNNAFWTLLKATNEFYWPDKQSVKFDDLSNNTNWDDSLAIVVLEKNRACLNSFDEAVRQPYLLVPEPKTLDDDDSYLEAWRKLSRLQSIEINSLHRAKKDKEAFGLALQLINFGQRVENSGGPLLAYLVGSSIKATGLMRIREMVVDTTLTGADLTQLIGGLDNFGVNKEGFTNAVKVEYGIQRNYVDDFASGTFPGTTNSSSGRAMKSIGMKLLFNPETTKRELTQADRFLINNFSKPYGEIAWSNMPGVETNISIFERVVRGNAFGDILFEMLAPIEGNFISRKSREDVDVTATQLVIALKVYKMENGNLPESLSELVPQFFPHVPLDDFDGQPFRYLPDKNIIYSVGPALKDFGGKERKGDSENYNLPFKIGF